MFQEKELEYASRYEEVVNRVEKEREKWRIQQAVRTHVEVLRQIEWGVLKMLTFWINWQPIGQDF